MSTLRNLPALVRDRFQGAQKSGDLTFFATKVMTLHFNGLLFQLRFSPALAQKPKGDKMSSSSTKPDDPFANPPPALHITAIPPSHYLVLNKFPVIPNHFILATKEYRKQTALLEERDLVAAWECVKAYKESGGELFGFFNSGRHSGASQMHRHLQFLDVTGMRMGLNDGEKGKDEIWSVLVDKLVEKSADLPFVYFAEVIPQDITPSRLHNIYAELYGRALEAAKEFASDTKDRDILTQNVELDESPLSYNIGLTDRAMVLFPRRSEGSTLKNETGDEIGSVALNGTILGGTLLVKTEAEWDALRENEKKLGDILRAIGIPKDESCRVSNRHERQECEWIEPQSGIGL